MLDVVVQEQGAGLLARYLTLDEGYIVDDALDVKSSEASDAEPLVLNEPYRHVEKVCVFHSYLRPLE